MKQDIHLEIAGLGLILYSPFAAAHIQPGQDYLSSHFMTPEDVAAHVTDCGLSAIGTGSPGSYLLRFSEGTYPSREISDAEVAIRLGIEVRDNTLCFRDLYDLLDWVPFCPADQCLELSDGFYLITAYSAPASRASLGDHQTINLHFERVPEKPRLRWEGVPDISGPY